MDDASDLTPLDPAYLKVMRLRALIPAAVLLAGATVLEFAQFNPGGLFLIPAALLAALLVYYIPPRRFARWGYRLDPDLLRIVRGRLFHSDTVVPLGRVQHVDVDQGPIARRYGLAMLTVHTAGNANASVSLPGLRHADALAMREAIGARIRRGGA
ncbi:MAG: PH domain-containing protein [Novosphingobium sp.]